ncbi:MAG: hypothetical protein EHM46_06205, partial [Bacteroidetes bacterium]
MYYRNPIQKHLPMKKRILPVIYLLLTLWLPAIGQQRTVTGTVSSPDGNPLPGVNVVIEGSTSGTITNNRGFYSLPADPENTLVFTYLGYESFETVVGSRSVIDITLDESVEELDEVVVIGYGETTRKSFTGSLTEVEAAEIEDIPQQNLVS